MTCFADVWTTKSPEDKFSFFSSNLLYHFNSRIVKKHFVSQTTWHNREMITFSDDVFDVVPDLLYFSLITDLLIYCLFRNKILKKLTIDFYPMLANRNS